MPTEDNKPCNCIDEITKSAAEHLKTSIEKETTVHEWHQTGRFKNIGYGVYDRSVKVGMPFIATYTRRKNNGDPERKETTREVSIYPTYCPFCGQKYPEKE